MKTINAILVVEGIADEAFIKSFLSVEIVKTSGYQIPAGEIDYLKAQLCKKGVIILTDSDEAGKTIRKRLNDLLPGVINVEVDLNKCDKHGKHGVAESTKEEILRVLAPYMSDIPNKTGTLTVADMNRLHLTGDVNSKNIREKVIKEFHLGEINMTTKTLVRRLNSLMIEESQIKKVIEGEK